MTDDTQTNTPDTQGKETDKPTEDNKPLSLYDKTEAIVTRQEAANKKTEELLARQETLHAHKRLSGDTGEHVEPTPAKEESNKDYNNRIDKEMSEGKHDE